MVYRGFVSGSYQSQSVVADAETTYNWYPENIESPYGENRMALYPGPGFAAFIPSGNGANQISDIGARAAFSVSETGRCFWVIGGGLWEIKADMTATRWGAVSQDANLATISYNGLTGNQLLITSGGNAYVFNLATNTLTQIAVLNGLATMGGMLNATGVVFNLNNGTVYWSALNDFTSWNPGVNFFTRTLRPDPWQAMVVGPDFKLWMIGSDTSEIWYYTGNLTNPFAPITAAVIPYGTPAPFSVKTIDNIISWVSHTARGQGMFVQASGYYPQRVSTHATAFIWAGYARTSTLADAEQIGYQDQDHPFNVVNFASANASWCFDQSTQLWHQRGKWDIKKQQFDVWQPRVHCHAFGQHLVGFRDIGTIGTMDVITGTEINGGPIRRLRRAPGIADEHRYQKYSIFEVLCETGLGLQVGQGADPQMMMRYSDDAGHTWSNERLASAGRTGEYRKRVYWDRCGVSRHRVFEVSATDPVPWRLINAFLNNRQGGRTRQAA